MILSGEEIRKHLGGQIVIDPDFWRDAKNNRTGDRFTFEVLRATGAGDAWNAGNILADHNGLSDQCRLLLANAVAACYLSGADDLHPTKDRLASFLKTNMQGHGKFF